ncbi:glycosyltransferase family 32 protein [Aspergillus ibericus CBS 121593]|uniref:Glycosyl transferase n=1 Tax=Aspergillus ibericus CBS 121593 TaxID=1448316 RepID=A0A395GIE1_9EURO|nr:glycosyl transferase [Aspergillus ibericus CBS 121593]RAK94976.1 glycosyl transferase [Aspergillus ibericus CBS 121593]
MISRCLLRRQVLAAITLMVLLTWLLYRPDTSVQEISLLEHRYPLLFQRVHTNSATGGAWYIPPGWTNETDPIPKTIIDAAEHASRAASTIAHRQIPYSSIPLIVHQTWKSTRVDTWPHEIRQSTEKWLRVVNGQMAYFLWDDEGVAEFIRRFEPALEEQFYALPSHVEQSDVFRVLVSKWIGGVYADIDTEPLQSPAAWITRADITPWEDLETGRVYNSTHPVQGIVGLEADCPPDGDSYWRMGYLLPTQLTQWAFAWAPGHPVLQTFIDHLFGELQSVSSHHAGEPRSQSTQAELEAMDPIALTGPVAFTHAVQSWLGGRTGLRWNALSGLQDGGRSKLVDDVLVLPITGFSPGRGKYGNMGSKPITDPAARLLHRAQGSWRAFNLRVEYGKFCRTVFGRCRYWSKVPKGLFL